jgi:hypothetical protein
MATMRGLREAISAGTLDAFVAAFDAAQGGAERDAA